MGVTILYVCPFVLAFALFCSEFEIFNSSPKKYLLNDLTDAQIRQLNTNQEIAILVKDCSK